MAALLNYLCLCRRAGSTSEHGAAFSGGAPLITRVALSCTYLYKKF